MRPESEVVVRRALGRVLDPVLVDHLRDDSPVITASRTAGVALSAADAIAVADAVQQVARESGAECVLVDEDLSVQAGPVTLDRLADSVGRRWRESVVQPSGKMPSGLRADGVDGPGGEDA